MGHRLEEQPGLPHDLRRGDHISLLAVSPAYSYGGPIPRDPAGTRYSQMFEGEKCL